MVSGRASAGRNPSAARPPTRRRAPRLEHLQRPRPLADEVRRRLERRFPSERRARRRGRRCPRPGTSTRPRRCRGPPRRPAGRRRAGRPRARQEARPGRAAGAARKRAPPPGRDERLQALGARRARARRRRGRAARCGRPVHDERRNAPFRGRHRSRREQRTIAPWPASSSRSAPARRSWRRSTRRAPTRRSGAGRRSTPTCWRACPRTRSASSTAEHRRAGSTCAFGSTRRTCRRIWPAKPPGPAPGQGPGPPRAPLHSSLSPESARVARAHRAETCRRSRRPSTAAR